MREWDIRQPICSVAIKFNECMIFKMEDQKADSIYWSACRCLAPFSAHFKETLFSSLLFYFLHYFLLSFIWYSFTVLHFHFHSNSQPLTCFHLLLSTTLWSSIFWANEERLSSCKLFSGAKTQALNWRESLLCFTQFSPDFELCLHVELERETRN